MVVCGYFDRGVLQEAQDIFTELGYQQGLAEVLYMLGEKNQYHQNISRSCNNDRKVDIMFFEKVNVKR